MAKKKHAGGLKSSLLRHQQLVKKQNAKSAVKSEQEKQQINKKKKLQQESALSLKNKDVFDNFDHDLNLLIVGDGDFSFTLAVLENGLINLGKNKIITTSYDSESELAEKYPTTFRENYTKLQEGPYKDSVRVFFNIDATNLIKSFKPTKFNIKNFFRLGENGNNNFLILFNFPHLGQGIKDQDRNIHNHQILVQNYFKASIEFFIKVINQSPIQDKTSDLNISSFRSQRIPMRIGLTLFEGEPYDSWQIKKIGRELNLVVERSNKFIFDNYKGYVHKRTNNEQNTTKLASTRNARTYIFQKYHDSDAYRLKNQKKRKGNHDSDSDSD